MDYYFTNLNGDPERTGKLGIKSAFYNPTDNQRYTFPGLLDTGSSANMISHKVGVEQYSSHQDTSPGAPATAKIYTIPLVSDIIGLHNITFPVDVGTRKTSFLC
jgi:hypothetical protein